MKTLANIFASVFDRDAGQTGGRRAIHREWDRQRARAMSPSDLAEIDAIFSRAL